MSVSAGQEFWFVAAGVADGQSSAQQRDELLGALQHNPAVNSKGRNRGDRPLGPMKFNVPDGDRSLMFGSFDNLIRLTDDLQKADSQLDSIVHRLERQYLEIEPKATFKMLLPREEKTFIDYFSSWNWNEAKYPRSRLISDNLGFLMSSLTKLDEEARNKTAQYNEVKTQKGNLAKKEGAMLPNRDMVDVLTPEVVKVTKPDPAADDDFIMTEHMTTVVVILPRGAAPVFLNKYETVCKFVAPRSAKQLKVPEDKDGNTVWRVVVFRTEVENFKKACRENRWNPRDFEYSEDAYRKLEKQRQTVEESSKRLHERIRSICQASWSEAMTAWMHLKAMRVFVESVLRFGMPPRFAAFVIPVPDGSTVALRKALADILGKGSQSYGAYDKMASASAEDGEEYFPYVSFSFTPFTAFGRT
eukprot:TRINITY_DN7887_c0_g1_i1.p1 TRINITY_DN7887_c0_g1~~TRINITY_DN7887_c0_g1_i1.p1  ORF type:complete len:416 (-),score=78.36 TRINITY_DN7887_c0_g1_i1:242-1489(-)